MPQDAKQQADLAQPLTQGAIVAGADPEALRRALDEAFDYRGDVTLLLKDGRTIEGYLFDRESGASLETSTVRIMPSSAPVTTPATDPASRCTITYAQIAEVRFTGRDTAAGKTWENWVRRYAEKKLKGERAEIVGDALE